MGDYKPPNHGKGSSARPRFIPREAYYKNCGAAGIPDKSLDNVDLNGSPAAKSAPINISGPAVRSGQTPPACNSEEEGNG